MMAVLPIVAAGGVRVSEPPPAPPPLPPLLPGEVPAALLAAAASEDALNGLWGAWRAGHRRETAQTKERECSAVSMWRAARLGSPMAWERCRWEGGVARTANERAAA